MNTTNSLVNNNLYQLFSLMYNNYEYVRIILLYRLYVCHQVYTSGKGSSAAGLTVSVTRDPVTVGPHTQCCHASLTDIIDLSHLHLNANM